MDVAGAVGEALGAHPLVESVELAGSRAAGTAHELSDWDFLVETRRFAELAPELPQLVERLRPLASQWDRYSHHACFMLMLRGPTKVDLIFPSERQEWAPPWTVTAESLPAIDVHFWDWILWLTQKNRRESDDTRSRLDDMYRLLLAPMGSEVAPASVSEALDRYLAQRDELERRFGVEVPRALQDEVEPAVRRALRRA